MNSEITEREKQRIVNKIIS